MKIRSRSQTGLTLVELSVTVGLVGVLGLIIYSMLNIGTILGAKNTATNTAHQQARVAMLEMIQDLHSSVSLPQLIDVSDNQASGIAFQQWSGGPHKIIANAAANQKKIHIAVTTGQPMPALGQRLIVQTHQIESDITAVSGSASDVTVTLNDNLSVAINGTTTGTTSSTSGDVVCYITDRCSYQVVQASAGPPTTYKLQWNKNGSRTIVNDITNPRPFSIPTTPAGALYYRFVAAIDLSTADAKYTNRGYKAANILLNGLVPYKARLTTYQ